MDNTAVLDFDALRRISRLGPRATRSRVERWAQKNGIRYRYDGRGGIWTTPAAMDAAVGIASAAGASGDTGGQLTAEDVF